jgi:glycosyltransferase involved in cell wall biosynthesis
MIAAPATPESAEHRLRLAVVVQRYGTEITGGAELHARLVAERLAGRHDVTVLTTCALDYVTWRNEYARGLSAINGIPVLRFPVRRPRDPEQFGRLQQRVFHRGHTPREAQAWMDAQGPYSPRMRRWIRHHREDFDYFLCFSYRYWTTFRALQEVEGRGILVPTAEPDPAVELPLFRDNFRRARAIMYNSYEERDMIVEHASNTAVPNVVVGVGIVEPPAVSAERFRAARGIEGPFLLYIGRIDANKGCEQLFRYYARAHAALTDAGETAPQLVLAGSALLDIPDHPGITYVGRVTDQEKYDALAACTALAMPSFYESLSMVLLEAWALSRPVLVNAHCAVLQGQARRANGGLWYHDGAEFVEACRLLGGDAQLGDTLGAAGKRYYDANYTWPVIEEKYEQMFQLLQAEART